MEVLRLGLFCGSLFGRVFEDFTFVSLGDVENRAFSLFGGEGGVGEVVRAEVGL